MEEKFPMLRYLPRTVEEKYGVRRYGDHRDELYDTIERERREQEAYKGPRLRILARTNRS